MAEFAALGSNDPLEPAVEKLVDGEFAEAFGAPYWRWKFRHSEATPNAGVYAATAEGELIAVVHFLRNEFRLGGGIVVDGVAAGDLVTDSRYRGKTVAAGLSRFGSQDAAAWEVPPDVVLMWTRPRLGRFYTKALGYTRVPASTIRYEKQLGTCSRLERITESGLLDELAQALPSPEAPTVAFCIDGSIPFLVKIEGGEIELSESGDRRVVVTGPRRLVRAYLARSHRRLVMAERLRRRLKIRGRPRSRRRMAPFTEVYLRILSAVIDS